MKPDFDAMNTIELRNYFLSNRNDDEAFQKLMDRLESSTDDSEIYPCPDTPETIAIMETAIQAQIKKLEEKR